jgi:hypothetical protein
MILRWFWLPGWLVILGACGAQEIRLGDARPVARQHVAVLTDAVEVKAGREQVVELRFRVQDGYHINSHTPKDGLLIPTELRLEAAPTLAVKGEAYPAGAAFRLAIGDGEVLDVYQGEFRVQVRVVAAPGSSTLTGSLKYQACDSSACFPPRVLPVVVAVSAR